MNSNLIEVIVDGVAWIEEYVPKSLNLGCVLV